MHIKIGERLIGENKPVFIIAEAGVNHNGDLALAKSLIKSAKEAGADAVKFQTFNTDQVVTSMARLVEYQAKAAHGKQTNQAEMLRGLELGKQEHFELMRYARQQGITMLSTPGDKPSVDLLEDIGVKAFKIGSDDLTNLPLLKYVAAKKKPIFLSTGMANVKEIRQALAAIKSVSWVPVIVMHATSLYPCPLDEVNMKALLTLREQLGLPVGYSDHTAGVSASMSAVSLGACVIEKHITLDRMMKGPDHKASYQPDEFRVFVKLLREVEDCLGSPLKGPSPGEKKDMPQIRKGLVASCDLPKGTLIKNEHLAVKRPLKGLGPQQIDLLVGGRAKKNIKKDQPLRMTDFIVRKKKGK